MSTLTPEMLAKAAERYRRLQLQDAFDPNNLKTRPTAVQQRVFEEFGTLSQQWIVASNQCLAKGTLVATPTGPIPIEDIKAGDLVYDEHGQPISVLKTFINGPKEVVEIFSEDGALLAEATYNHVWLTEEGQLSTAELPGKTLVVHNGKAIKVRLGMLRVEETYDIHVDSPTNLYLLANGLVTHNSGKTQTCSRLAAWVLAENHPHWERPKHWNKEPLLLIICGRTGKQLEESLVPRICAYLPPEDYKVVRIGNITQRIEHVNGNRIVFQSLENPQLARERVQSYVAHFVWVDEMPSTVQIISELLMRIQSKQGYFIASFTPLVHNADIRKMVDEVPSHIGRKYKFRMFDNPIYSDPDRQAQVLASYAHLSDVERNCRLEGDWMEAESAVWHIDRDFMVEAPPNYHPSWRHVEASDPAVSSKFGISIWAECPSSSVWYCIRDDYIEGIAAPDDIVAEVKRRTSNLNVMRRICDPHESWYLGQASKAGLSYICPKKDGRKEEMIKNLQHALSSGKIKIAPWCTRLLDELERAQWSQTETNRARIVGGSKLHQADTAQYFVDLIPAPSKEHKSLSWHAELRVANEERKRAAVEKQALKVGRRKRWILR
jgi:hypothetical protein